MLYERAHRGAFEHIALIAPPKTLGELRQALHQEVSDRVIAEVPKTLTNHPIEEIERQLRNGLIAA
jgi:protein required for attachment to host cells